MSAVHPIFGGVLDEFSGVRAAEDVEETKLVLSAVNEALMKMTAKNSELQSALAACVEQSNARLIMWQEAVAEIGILRARLNERN